jgi:hypothetical protein
MSHLLRIGDSSESFYLPRVDARMYSLEPFKAFKTLVILFACNNNSFKEMRMHYV